VKGKPMHWLTWIGIVFIALGTAFTIIGQQKINDKSNILLQSKSDRIAVLSQQNIELSSELSKTNKEIAATVTGGDSFCYLFPSPSFGKLNTIDFNLQHMGKYPVYDAFIRVWDSSCLKKIEYGKIFQNRHGYQSKEFTYEEWLVTKEDPKFIRANKEVESDIKEQMERCLLIQKNLGTITPKKSSNLMDPPLITFTIPDGIDVNKFNQKYSVSIVARNGEYKQEISIDIRNKRYHIYSKVEKVSTGAEPVLIREFESVDTDAFLIKIIK
jgi:hypothetical protein